jgi:hypothetical protein
MEPSPQEFARAALRAAVLKLLKEKQYSRVESMALDGIVRFAEQYLETVFRRAKELCERTGATRACCRRRAKCPESLACSCVARVRRVVSVPTVVVAAWAVVVATGRGECTHRDIYNTMVEGMVRWHAGTL